MLSGGRDASLSNQCLEKGRGSRLNVPTVEHRSDRQGQIRIPLSHTRRLGSLLGRGGRRPQLPLLQDHLHRPQAQRTPPSPTPLRRRSSRQSPKTNSRHFPGSRTPLQTYHRTPHPHPAQARLTRRRSVRRSLALQNCWRRTRNVRQLKTQGDHGDWADAVCIPAYQQCCMSTIRVAQYHTCIKHQLVALSCKNS